MSGAYATVDILKSLPIHGMASTSTGRLGKQKFDSPEATKTPTPGSKSMVEGLKNPAGSVQGLGIYIYNAKPNHHYTSTHMMAYHHLNS